jgi:hypothetical protein
VVEQRTFNPLCVGSNPTGGTFSARAAALSLPRALAGATLCGVLLEIWTYVAMALSVAMCAVVVYFLLQGRDDRQREEEAREYFDAHGHWPDEA